ncbi:VOC family protein [Pseudovibrio sp. POLY-S9]|uniref:VOC family protein n=1 Tax=Pseudovibrio sp. POLY-S9 TaxID=1576596 RepID=UPI00070E55E7|nr:VOC family protein [Pseudovibrio sp. POLY-S9]
MLHHVEIYVSDKEISRHFWSSILSHLEYKETASWDDGFTLSTGKDAYLTFVQVSPQYESHAYHRCGVGLNHLAFSVKSREQVDLIRHHCRTEDIPMLYDEKYPFANGGTDYYALYLEDPDRIKVEFVAEQNQ